MKIQEMLPDITLNHYMIHNKTEQRNYSTQDSSSKFSLNNLEMFN